MTAAVRILGDGVAACCCAKLFSANSVPYSTESKERFNLPAILISESTQLLVRDVFADSTIFRGLHRINKRIVAWGPEAKPAVIPHSAVVASEEMLLKRLWEKMPYGTDNGMPREHQPSQWTILSSTNGDYPRSESGFGSRVASLRAVRLTAKAEKNACWIESTASGWLFLLSTGEEDGVLIAVGQQPDELIEEGRLIPERIDILSTSEKRSPAYPRIHYPLSGADWMACGAAALTFDPLCGEGAGNAVREAILASATVRAVLQGSEPMALLEEYSVRMLGGFHRHLELCKQFYLNGGVGDWWKAELELLEKGIAWTHHQLQAASRPKHKLVGFELQPLSSRV
jgi:hypothetical protein